MPMTEYYKEFEKLYKLGIKIPEGKMTGYLVNGIFQKEEPETPYLRTYPDSYFIKCQNPDCCKTMDVSKKLFPLELECDCSMWRIKKMPTPSGDVDYELIDWFGKPETIPVTDADTLWDMVFKKDWAVEIRVEIGLLGNRYFIVPNKPGIPIINLTQALLSMLIWLGENKEKV